MSKKMKTINSVSGGKTSSYIAAHYPADYNIFSLVCIDDPKCAPKDKALSDYVNNKLSPHLKEQHGEFIATTEDDKTLVALMELEQFIGKEIIWVRGKSFEKVLKEASIFGGTKTRLPNRMFRYCTLEMKMLPIFDWWFLNVGERVKMNIGFRMNEYERMERFMNSGRQNELRIPDYCSTRGKKKQHKTTFTYRWCSFPLIKDVIYEQDVIDFWEGKIDFPIVSNCVGCFFKKPDTLAVMCNEHPEKLEWFARQEEEMGVHGWIQGLRYRDIINFANLEQQAFSNLTLQESGAACDSGGCTD